jgi:hypothetical protein
MTNRRNELSVITLAGGSVATAGSAIIAYFYANSVSILAALLIALTGLALTLILDQRVKLGDVERLVTQASVEASIETEISRLSKVDDFFNVKYAELKTEMADLARGIYQIRTLTSLYQDDIRSITRLRSGETLLSTCPVTPASKAEAVGQITSPAYQESMRAHLEAVNRGVKVTRIYLIRDITFFLNPPITHHLTELEKAGMDVRVILRDQVILDSQFDFLVFGSNKVSVGVAEPGAGTVSGAIVYTDATTIRRYAAEYEKLRVMSMSPSDILRTHKAGDSE